ncbi:Aste57867_16929 [Aphanomyces stellatus]|uniref:Aste57867_16929 protein n=1 Tax=Aphanomyces stellatus TaxID=120398 RepID=A0A485L7H8_9STRA|nr:hypothetical protein As57867_016871 [Aphanomyces stellatus]VFT93691.1 Aste57867_16929 [Aphanomyces stellatus]
MLAARKKRGKNRAGVTPETKIITKTMRREPPMPKLRTCHSSPQLRFVTCTPPTSMRRMSPPGAPRFERVPAELDASIQKIDLFSANCFVSPPPLSLSAHPKPTLTTDSVSPGDSSVDDDPVNTLSLSSMRIDAN